MTLQELFYHTSNLQMGKPWHSKTKELLQDTQLTIGRGRIWACPQTSFQAWSLSRNYTHPISDWVPPLFPLLSSLHSVSLSSLSIRLPFCLYLFGPVFVSVSNFICFLFLFLTEKWSISCHINRQGCYSHQWLRPSKGEFLSPGRRTTSGSHQAVTTPYGERGGPQDTGPR